eukprot:4680828-Lingulodinium_polyedra.AAC.1
MANSGIQTQPHKAGAIAGCGERGSEPSALEAIGHAAQQQDFVPLVAAPSKAERQAHGRHLPP